MDDFLAAKMEDFANPQGAEVEKPTSKPEGFAPPSMDGEKEGEKTLPTALDTAKEGTSEEAVAMTQKVARRSREARTRSFSRTVSVPKRGCKNLTRTRRPAGGPTRPSG